MLRYGDMFKQNPYSNTFEGLKWQNSDGGAFPTHDGGLDDTLDSQFLNHDIEIEELPQQDLYAQNSALSQPGTEY